MGRYLGPKHRLCRWVGEQLCGLDRCPIRRRNYPPGVHGQRGRRKITEFGAQLTEKQKARMIYGILERQFRLYFERARRMPGDTGEHLQRLLEQRLDNAVYRLGFSKSRGAARQAVVHGHITVNGRRVSIPSYQVAAGDTIAIRTSSQQSPVFREYPKLAAQLRLPAWLAAKPDTYAGQVIRLPTAADAPTQFNVRSIVEFYSR